MLIDKIELYLVRNTFSEPWHTAYGTDEENCVLITRMISGNHEGWSESSPLPGPHYSYEYGEGIYQLASRFLAPHIVGRDMATAGDVAAAMSAVKGNPFAKAGIEMAWWTLQADIKGVPLRRLLGQAGDPIVEQGVGYGIYDKYDDLIERVGRSFDKGVKRVKLKAAHGWDVDMVAAVRSVFPHQKLHIDCNASYTYDEVETFKKLDRFHLEMIEQPFAPGDLLGHAKLQKQLDTPICLDEGIVDPLSVAQALELGACRYVNIKPARVGGLGNSLEINRLCAQAGVGCWVGGMLESDVGKSICVELASIPNMVYPHDITPETEGYLETICEVPLENCAPYQFQTTSQPGTPIKPDMAKMLAKTEKHCVIEAK